MKNKLILLCIELMALSLPLNAQVVYAPTSSGDIEQLPGIILNDPKAGRNTLELNKSIMYMNFDGRHAATMLPRTSIVFYAYSPINLSTQAWKIIPLKEKKDSRILPLRTFNLFKKKANDNIALTIRQISDDVYELRPMSDVKGGEYVIALIEDGFPTSVFDFRVEPNLPSYPQILDDSVLDKFYPHEAASANSYSNVDEYSSNIIRWYFDSDPRGARIFYRVISNVPQQVKNTNESYLTTTPLEETKALNIPGLNYENAADVVIEIKLTKRGYEDQVKRYNVRQALDQQEISGFFELVEKK